MARVWKIAPGNHAEEWELFRDCGCIGIGWLPQGNYDDFKNEDDVLSVLEKRHGKGTSGYGRGAAEMIMSFVKDIDEEDIVVANDAYNGCNPVLHGEFPAFSRYAWRLAIRVQALELIASGSHSQSVRPS